MNERGKDLRWNPVHVARDARMVWSAFRNTRSMVELMDGEHMEQDTDAATMLVARMDLLFHDLVELLTEGAGKQKAKREELKLIEAAKERKALTEGKK